MDSSFFAARVQTIMANLILQLLERVDSSGDEPQPTWVKEGPAAGSAAAVTAQALQLSGGSFESLIQQAAQRYGVDSNLVKAVIRAESNFNPVAQSNKNAQGLMQLIPDTSARFNVKKPFDPEQNLRGGLAYLRWLLAYFEGDVSLVAAAYNAGEGAVNRYRGVPPYAETRGYVKRIIGLFKRDDHPYDSRVTTPSPELPRIRLTKGS